MKSPLVKYAAVEPMFSIDDVTMNSPGLTAQRLINAACGHSVAHLTCEGAKGQLIRKYVHMWLKIRACFIMVWHSHLVGT